MLVKELVESMAYGVINVRDYNGILLSSTPSLYDMPDSVKEREIDSWEPVKYQRVPAIRSVVLKTDHDHMDRDINEIMDDMKDLLDEFFDYADSLGVGELL